MLPQSGASWTTSHFLGLLRHASDENSLVRQIDFVWVVRHSCTSLPTTSLPFYLFPDSGYHLMFPLSPPSAHLSWFRPQLESALASTTLPASLVVNLKFCVSSPTGTSEASSLGGEDHESVSEPEHEKPQATSSGSADAPFELGRPDLSLMLSRMAKEAVGLSLAVGGELFLLLRLLVRLES